jgi:hypothetical protein
VRAGISITPLEKSISKTRAVENIHGSVTVRIGGKNRTQLALNPETTFEKMVLTAGIIVGGRNPATTTAIVAAISAYSIRS